MNIAMRSELRLEPLTGLGMRWRGVDANEIADDPSAVDALRAAMTDHRVVLLAGAHLTAKSLLALARAIGEPLPVRAQDSLFDEATRPFLLNAASPLSSGLPAPATTHAEQVWHADYTAAEPMAGAVLLQATRSPPHSGALSFVDMVAVHEALPTALQQRIEPLSAIHYTHPAGVDIDRQDIAVTRDRRESGVAHPLVARHASGARSLLLPYRRDSVIAGLDDAESSALLGTLWTHVDAVVAAGRHHTTQQMRSGDVVLWDNIAALHRRAAWDAAEPRSTWLVTIAA